MQHASACAAPARAARAEPVRTAGQRGEVWQGGGWAVALRSGDICPDADRATSDDSGPRAGALYARSTGHQIAQHRLRVAVLQIDGTAKTSEGGCRRSRTTPVVSTAVVW